MSRIGVFLYYLGSFLLLIEFFFVLLQPKIRITTDFECRILTNKIIKQYEKNYLLNVTCYHRSNSFCSG